MNNKKSPLCTPENTSTIVYKFLLILSIIICLFGLIYGNPIKSVEGLIKIVLSPDGLISDYMEIGGIGGAFLNAGLVMLISIGILKLLKLPFAGISIACIFLMGGFALFGKNVFNILPIIIGGWLYSKSQGEHFGRYIYSILFGTTLAPAVTEVAYQFNFSPFISFIFMISIGILIGFLLPPVATFTLRVHQGYNLYNVGFAAGLIGLILTSIFRSLGCVFTVKLFWSTKYTLPVAIFLSILFLCIITLGYILNGNSIKGFLRITRHSGRAVADFVVLDGIAPSLINMGVIGFMAMFYVLLVGGPLNGPTVGGIFTVVGFGAFGKHPKNITPVVLGVVLSSFFMVWKLDEPAMLLAALFSTGLAPIAGQFGAIWGIIIGIVHSVVTRDVSSLHGWLNLYNNGFAAGIICIVAIPVIEALKKDDYQ